VHPAAEILPLLKPDRLQELADDIAAVGLRNPVQIWQDHEKTDWLLDGRNRALACEIVGITPNAEYYEGDDPLDFVISEGLYRRDLTTGQRASVAVKATALRERLQQEALQRMQSGKGDPDPDSGQGSRRRPQTTDELGKQFKVSGTSVEDYARLQKNSPDLAKKVDSGEISLNKATTLLRERLGPSLKKKEEPCKQKPIVQHRSNSRHQLDTLTNAAEQMAGLAGVLEGMFPDQTTFQDLCTSKVRVEQSRLIKAAIVRIQKTLKKIEVRM